MAKTKRQQSAESESQYNTRQDRNTFLTDGGLWEWDSGTGTISWTADAKLQRGSLVEDTITGPDSVAGLTAINDILYAQVNRTTGGTTLTAGVEVDKATGTATLTDADDLVVLAVRSSDGKVYFRNGTVFSDGEIKAFGTVKAITDRAEVTALGTAAEVLVTFDYILASNQLAVYVGGILQIAGTHYTESTASPGGVTFIAGFIPSAGELITFIDILGGQGPAGSSQVSLQDAWSNGNDIDSATGTAVYFWDTAAGTAVAHGGNAAYPGGRKWLVTSDGEFQSIAGTSGYSFFDDTLAEEWHFRPLDTPATGSALVIHTTGAGYRVDPSGLMEWGAYAGGSYPFLGGTWSGDGGIRWTVYTGTTLSGPNEEVLANTGLSEVLGIAFSVYETAGSTRKLLLAANGPQNVNDQMAVTFDSATGDITLSYNLDGTIVLGGNYQASTWHMVVFHQG